MRVLHPLFAVAAGIALTSTAGASAAVDTGLFYRDFDWK